MLSQLSVYGENDNRKMEKSNSKEDLTAECTYVDRSHDDNDLIFKLEASAAESRANALSHKITANVPFPAKLHILLDRIENDGKAWVISWQPHGRCFQVHDPKAFADDVMPSYFRQSKFASFQRQLNLYGFQRLSTGRDKGGYYHEYFLRGKQHLSYRIHREKVKGTRVRKASTPKSEPQFYNMPPVGLPASSSTTQLVETPKLFSAAGLALMRYKELQQQQQQQLQSQEHRMRYKEMHLQQQQQLQTQEQILLNAGANITVPSSSSAVSFDVGSTQHWAAQLAMNEALLSQVMSSQPCAVPPLTVSDNVGSSNITILSEQLHHLQQHNLDQAVHAALVSPQQSSTRLRSIHSAPADVILPSAMSCSEDSNSLISNALQVTSMPPPPPVASMPTGLYPEEDYFSDEEEEEEDDPMMSALIRMPVEPSVTILASNPLASMESLANLFEMITE